mgnify:CR=1 FL=1
MAKTSMKIKQQRPAKFSTREYNRCRICGRPHAYLRKSNSSVHQSSPQENTAVAEFVVVRMHI